VSPKEHGFLENGSPLCHEKKKKKRREREREKIKRKNVQNQSEMKTLILKELCHENIAF